MTGGKSADALTHTDLDGQAAVPRLRGRHEVERVRQMQRAHLLHAPRPLQSEISTRYWRRSLARATGVANALSSTSGPLMWRCRTFGLSYRRTATTGTDTIQDPRASKSDQESNQRLKPGKGLWRRSDGFSCDSGSTTSGRALAGARIRSGWMSRWQPPSRWRVMGQKPVLSMALFP